MSVKLPDDIDALNTCIVCPGALVYDSDIAAHRSGRSHCEKVGDAYSVAYEYMERSKEVSKILAGLRGSGVGMETSFHSRMISYLFQSDGTVWTKEQLEAQAHRLHRSVSLRILELKLWKTACLLYPPKPMNDVTALLFWMADGWKANKAAMRHNELITVVVENVVPFLDKLPTS